MKRVYIAGPMRGYPLQNFPAFHAAAAAWRAAGWEVISPAELDQQHDGFDGSDMSKEPVFTDAMRRDIEAVLSVDAVAFLPGFERSTGSKIEHTVAEAIGLRLYDARNFRPLPQDIRWENRPTSSYSESPS